MDILELKYNGGKGALLCSRCRYILNEGWEHEHIKECKHCGKKYNIVKHFLDDTVYHFANKPEV